MKLGKEYEGASKRRKRGAPDPKAKMSATKMPKMPANPRRPLEKFHHITATVMKVKNPTSNMPEGLRKATNAEANEQWKLLSKDDQKPYKNSAAQEKAEYEVNMKKYVEANPHELKFLEPSNAMKEPADQKKPHVLTIAGSVLVLVLPVPVLVQVLVLVLVQVQVLVLVLYTTTLILEIDGVAVNVQQQPHQPHQPSS
jgi:hypothetical protein